MELQIQKEKLNVKKRIGEKNKKIMIEKDVILPDSKPDIIKIQAESSNVYMTKKENMENKLKIDGGILTRITYLTGDGKSKVLKVEENFSEALEIQGMIEESYTNEKIYINSINVSILNERKIHYKAEIMCDVIATKKEEIEYIYEINQSHNLQTLTQKRKIDTFIGHGESKIGIKEKMDTENLQENIEVVHMSYLITNTEKKISYNKVLLKADCELKCLYQTESGHTYLSQKPVPIMGFLDIENVEEDNQISTEYSIRNLNITESDNDFKHSINIEIEFNVTGDVYKTKEINVITDLYDLNYKTEFTKQKVELEEVNASPLQTNTVNQKTIIEDINQIYNTEYTINKMDIKGENVEFEIRAMYLYNSFETQMISKKEVVFTKEIKIESDMQNFYAKIVNESTNILPDSSVNTKFDIQLFSASSNSIELINEIKLNDEENDEGYSMIIYFVKPGDSLWKIAKQFKSTVKEIASLNEIPNEDEINIGDKLYIPRAI